MKKIIILGAGLVGKAIAVDLCKDYNVCSVDLNKTNLKKLSSEYPVETVQADTHCSLRDGRCDWSLGAVWWPAGARTVALQEASQGPKQARDLQLKQRVWISVYESGQRIFVIWWPLQEHPSVPSGSGAFAQWRWHLSQQRQAAAYAVSRDGEIGSLEIGKKMDLILCDIPNYYHLVYHLGINPVKHVIKDGRAVVKEGQVLKHKQIYNPSFSL